MGLFASRFEGGDLAEFLPEGALLRAELLRELHGDHHVQVAALAGATARQSLATHPELLAVCGARWNPQFDLASAQGPDVYRATEDSLPRGNMNIIVQIAPPRAEGGVRGDPPPQVETAG